MTTIEIMEDVATQEMLNHTVMEEMMAMIATDYEPDTIDTDVLTLLISRLAQVLAKEVDLLENMQVQELGKLQPEKCALLDALEKQKKVLARRPALLEHLSDDERSDLAELIELFEAVMHENHNKLLVAKEVNKSVVEAIMDVTAEQMRSGLYTERGQHAEDSSLALSLNRSI
jgi:hypothetical protein